MEDRGEADAGAEVLGVGRDRGQGLGRGLEQEVVDDRLVLIGDVGDRRRQREHDMIVWHRQQLGLARGQPVLAAAPWHFGQCRLRQELYEMWLCAHSSQRAT